MRWYPEGTLCPRRVRTPPIGGPCRSASACRYDSPYMSGRQQPSWLPHPAPQQDPRHQEHPQHPQDPQDQQHPHRPQEPWRTPPPATLQIVSYSTPLSVSTPVSYTHLTLPTILRV